MFPQRNQTTVFQPQTIESISLCKSFQRYTKFSPWQPVLNLQRVNFCEASKSSVTLDKECLKELRSISGAPLKECKKALQETNNSIEDALDWLRVQGVATAKKKSDQVAANGFVVTMTSDDSNDNCKYGSITEVNCVTDFVENNPIFQNAATNIGNTILLSDKLECNTFQDISKISEDINIIPCKNENNNSNVDDNNDQIRENQTLGEALTDIINTIRENLIIRR